MNKFEIVQKIEEFAPLNIQKSWDCSGWLVETEKTDIKKVLLCLTVTQDIINQAISENCDMIISHHPLFHVPINWKNIDIYCAHTNLDKTFGGTTDCLIETLNLKVSEIQEFVRFVDVNITLKDFYIKLKEIAPNLRYVNNKQTKVLSKIAFCAGSGSEFIQQAFEKGADAFVTGDLKFHTALDSPIVIFDIGHFESEILVLPVFEKLIGSDIEYVYAKEESPFKYNLDNEN